MSNVLKMLSRGGSAAAATDEHFENTVLLLHGDGTNGAQNNTFLDSSTNNFTITRNGNTTQGTFSPFSKPDGRWGNYFDGSGDYLSIPDNAVFDLAADFTIEFWMNFAVLPSSAAVAMISTYDGGSGGYYVQYRTDLGGRNLRFGSSSTLFIDDTAFDPVVGTFYHIAVVRSGTDVKMYINGVASSSTATTSNSFTSSVPFLIGHLASGTQMFNGWISNVRVVKGTAVYTSGFTPSTSPLTAISGTSLLTCQSNRFVDNSSNAFAITRNGDVKVTPFSPFPLTTAYDPAVNGGAGYFDGSGDYLSVADNAALEIPTQDFTIEAWVYLPSLPSSGSQYTIIQKGRTGTSNFEYSFELDNNSGSMRLVFRTTSNGTTLVTANGNTISLTANQWSHCAVTRIGTTAYFWFNGVAAGSGTVNGTTYTGSATVGIGANDAGGSPIAGYMSSFRLVKGTAVYTTGFTPPTSPLTAIANTSLLTNFTNAGILDNTGFNALETVGNAQIDTTVKKYGTGAMKFDGSGDGLRMANSPALTFGSENFTVEAWIYVTSGSVVQQIIGSHESGTAASWLFYLFSDNKLRLLVNSTTYAESASGISLNQWVHVAGTREGNNLYVYVNGVKSTGQSFTGSVNANSYPITIGIDQDGDETPFFGYIDDLRITRGIARYTSNFTPPDKALPDIGV
jgi:hypothetical protein